MRAHQFLKNVDVNDINQVLTVADKAIEYANRTIIKDTTSPESNNLKYNKFRTINNGIIAIRHCEQGFPLEKPVVQCYEHYINVSKKFSMGNCYEKTLQAFDYIMHKYKINAYVYEVKDRYQLESMDNLIDSPTSKEIIYIARQEKNINYTVTNENNDIIHDYIPFEELENLAPKLAEEIDNAYTIGYAVDRALIKYFSETIMDIIAMHGHIRRGDHVFLVLNQAPGCDKSNPDTWGDNAVICDPLLKKAYPASQHQVELNNFYSGYDEKNYFSPLQEGIHFVKPINGINTQFLRSNIKRKYLKENCLKFMRSILQTVDNYQNRFLLSNRLINACNNDHNKKNILDKKELEISDLITKIVAAINKLKKTDITDNYRITKVKFITLIKAAAENAFNVMQFSPDDLSILLRNKKSGLLGLFSTLSDPHYSQIIQEEIQVLLNYATPLLTILAPEKNYQQYSYRQGPY